MAAQQATTTPTRTRDDLQSHVLSLTLARLIFPRNFDGHNTLYLSVESGSCRCKGIRSYPFVLLNNLRNLRQTFVVHPVHTRKVFNGITDLQAGLVCWTSRHETVDLCEGWTRRQNRIFEKDSSRGGSGDCSVRGGRSNLRVLDALEMLVQTLFDMRHNLLVIVPQSDDLRSRSSNYRSRINQYGVRQGFKAMPKFKPYSGQRRYPRAGNHQRSSGMCSCQLHAESHQKDPSALNINKDEGKLRVHPQN